MAHGSSIDGPTQAALAKLIDGVVCRDGAMWLEAEGGNLRVTTIISGARTVYQFVGGEMKLVSLVADVGGKQVDLTNNARELEGQ